MNVIKVCNGDWEIFIHYIDLKTSVMNQRYVMYAGSYCDAPEL